MCTRNSSKISHSASVPDLTLADGFSSQRFLKENTVIMTREFQYCISKCTLVKSYTAVRRVIRLCELRNYTSFIPSFFLSVWASYLKNQQQQTFLCWKFVSSSLALYSRGVHKWYNKWLHKITQKCSLTIPTPSWCALLDLALNRIFKLT